MTTADSGTGWAPVGRGLRWLTLGRSTRVAWGRCQGSAADPYRTVIAADHPSTSSCTCPSRQRPCKHARGLADLAADGQVAIAAEPGWVSQLADRRPFAESSAREVEAGSDDGPVDPDAAVKRAEARRARVDAGLVELRLWLTDQVRSGLSSLPRAGYGHFDTIAARMVDAQAPGVASTLRSLPADLVSADWPNRALNVLGGLYLLAEAHARVDELSEDLAATVRSRVGYQVSKDQVRARPPVRDRWWALAAVDTVEFQLTSRRVWLRGLDTGRWAMWLTFAPAGRELDDTIRPGRIYDCDAHFYPGSGLRALLEPLDGADPSDTGPTGGGSEPSDDPAPDAETARRGWAGDDLTTIRSQLAALLTGDPWATRLPVVVAGVPQPPRDHGGTWRLRDSQGLAVPFTDLDGDPWPLVAQAGNEPLQVMGEFDGHGLRPLAVLSDDRGRRYSTTLTG